MSLRRFLTIYSHWDEPLSQSASAEIISAAVDETGERDMSDFDPVDHLLRKEIQHWAVYQAPPVEAKQKLLQAAAHQHEAVDVDLLPAHSRAEDELRRGTTRGHEMLANYLMLSTQYMHVRLVA